MPDIVGRESTRNLLHVDLSELSIAHPLISTGSGGSSVFCWVYAGFLESVHPAYAGHAHMLWFTGEGCQWMVSDGFNHGPNPKACNRSTTDGTKVGVRGDVGESSHVAPGTRGLRRICGRLHSVYTSFWRLMPGFCAVTHGFIPVARGDFAGLRKPAS